MNMFLHYINYDKFNIQLGDTLRNPHFGDDKPFDAIAANDYSLSVSSYVEAKDNREVVDITKRNAELKITVAKIDRLRKDIDAIVAEIESEELDETATVNHQLTVQKEGGLE
jgi:type I restriction-modification system DNA methylase subunit